MPLDPKALTRFLDNCATERANRTLPWGAFNDVLSRIADHRLQRLAELLPHNWKPLTTNA
jgi:hypothetical protein